MSAGGVAPAAAQAIDPTFNLELAFQGSGINASIVLQSGGRVLTAGSFSDGVSGILRFHDDGTLDPSFNAGTVGGQAAPFAIITRLAVLSNDKILVAGQRTSAGSGEFTPIVRLMPDGALDTTFVTPIYGRAYDMLVEPDGKILIAGIVRRSQGGVEEGLIRLNADGGIDSGYQPAVNGIASTMARYTDGRLLVGGFFVTVDGVARTSLVRLLPSGDLDLTFADPPLPFILTGFIRIPVLIRPDGHILVGTFAGTILDRITAGITQLNNDGTVDTTFNPVIEDALVLSLVTQADGKILVSGEFGTVNGVDVAEIFRLNADGTLDLSFGTDLASHNSGGIGGLLLLPDGRFYASGDLPRGLSRLLPNSPDPIEADLQITKTAPTTAMTNGGTIAYTIKVKNNAAVRASGVTISDTLPAGLTFASCRTFDGGTCAGIGNSRTISWGSLKPGETVTVTLGANITPAAPAVVVNTATVSSYSPDPVAGNNSSSATSYRNPPVLADLSITKTASLATAGRGGGESLNYTLSIHNDGPDTATAVEVTDLLPAGVTFSSCSASGGTCAGSGNARSITYTSIASGATRTITIRTTLNGSAPGAIVNTATVTSTTQDPSTSNNSATVTTLSAMDTDDDGLPDEWETRFGLRTDLSTGNDGRRGDPDNDGADNAEELARGTHPRGFATRYLAEGALNDFFDVRLALLNVGTADARLLFRYLQPGGTVLTRFETLAPNRRRTVTRDDLAALSSPDFSTVVESDQPLVLDRTMSWNHGRGSHAETGVPTPSTTWYLAEGSTSGEFVLFYLFQNPNPAATTVTVRYLRPFGLPPVVKLYTLAPSSRLTIPVDDEGPELASTDISGVITSTLPIIVERAMYRSTPTETFAAGHGSTGVTAPSTSWFLAEGATGPFFDCFILLANPNPQPATVTIDYLLDDGRTMSKQYSVPADGRVTVFADGEEIPVGSGQHPLDNVAMSSSVTSDIPIIVERTMWWPSPASTPNYWTEAHNSAGAVVTGTKWALAEGEVGGTDASETYILIANTSATGGSATVTLYFEDGTSAAGTFALLPRSRRTVGVSTDFPSSIGKRFSAVIESHGTPAPQIVVERAMYTSPGGDTWTAGTNALATKLQ